MSNEHRPGPLGERLRDLVSDGVDAARPHMAKAADEVSDRARQVAETGRERLDEGIRRVTLEEWREEVDGGLEDIVAVLVSLDAEVRRLRQDNAALEERLAQLEDER